MTISPLTIASDGYLAAARRPLALATSGYLGAGEVVITIPQRGGGGSSSSSRYQFPSTPTASIEDEDAEIITLISVFMNLTTAG